MALTSRGIDHSLEEPPLDFRMREIAISTVDGEVVSAGVAAAGREAVGGITFVLVHGFTGGWREKRGIAVAAHLARFGKVMAIDLRGHGKSSGRSTIGFDEVLDVDAAVAQAKTNDPDGSVITVGFSMGGSIVLRHGALAPGRHFTPSHVPDAVVSVSSPGFWFYRGTKIMRTVHRLIESPAGRAALALKGVRITSTPWPEPPPLSPEQCVKRIVDIPVLILHGDADHYFPIEHARVLERAVIESGNARSSVKVIPGLGHAESAVDPATMDIVGAWSRETASVS